MPASAPAAWVARLADDLRACRSVDDRRFDRLLATPWRFASDVHWTPLDVCQTVIRWLAPQANERVLDVGSGVGKLCIVGALSTAAVFVGVEQRPLLVEQARLTAQALGADRTLLVMSDALAFDWRPYQCLYLYNPFGELDLDAERRIDSTLVTGHDVYLAHVAATERKLDEMPSGTRVVTFHGFGGDMPEAYAPVRVEQLAGGSLALWIKTGPTDA